MRTRLQVFAQFYLILFARLVSHAISYLMRAEIHAMIDDTNLMRSTKNRIILSCPWVVFPWKISWNWAENFWIFYIFYTNPKTAFFHNNGKQQAKLIDLVYLSFQENSWHHILTAEHIYITDYDVMAFIAWNRVGRSVWTFQPHPWSEAAN